MKGSRRLLVGFVVLLLVSQLLFALEIGQEEVERIRESLMRSDVSLEESERQLSTLRSQLNLSREESRELTLQLQESRTRLQMQEKELEKLSQSLRKSRRETLIAGTAVASAVALFTMLILGR